MVPDLFRTFAVLFGLVVVLPTVAAIVAAAIVRSACRMWHVNEPPYLRAMGMVLLNVFLFLLAYLGIAWLFQFAILGTLKKPHQILAMLIALVVCMPVSALIYSRMLGVRFGRGLLIWLVQVVLVMCVPMLVGRAASPYLSQPPPPNGEEASGVH